ncbi:hypothetical protein J4447_02670 [Candidatus Pacearchaeota archaeon]|nr:hypothetical protein [Candidatus Pacearchaeota archaeon]
MFVKKPDKVIFINDFLEESFNKLQDNNWLKKSLRKAIEDFKENAFCGERIHKYLIPKIYIKDYGIDNLWWYPLANAWRLVYSITTKDQSMLLMIVEYFNHKDYERRFGYH